MADMLAPLLGHTKLGTERKWLLRWLSQPHPRILEPRPLLGGSPNAGLTNQLFSLVGVCCLANLTGAALVLPRFAGGDVANASLPFSKLFDVQTFIARMRGTIRASAGRDGSSSFSTGGTRPFALGSDRGWFLYKAIALAFPPKHDRRYVHFQRIQFSVLLALRPSQRMRDRGRKFAAMLGLGPPGSFGCIHPRLERDMVYEHHMNTHGHEGTTRKSTSPARITRLPWSFRKFIRGVVCYYS